MYENIYESSRFQGTVWATDHAPKSLLWNRIVLISSRGPAKRNANNCLDAESHTLSSAFSSLLLVHPKNSIVITPEVAPPATYPKNAHATAMSDYGFRVFCMMLPWKALSYELVAFLRHPATYVNMIKNEASLRKTVPW
jgi:hypothetical protein